MGWGITSLGSMIELKAHAPLPQHACGTHTNRTHTDNSNANESNGPAHDGRLSHKDEWHEQAIGFNMALSMPCGAESVVEAVRRHCVEEHHITVLVMQTSTDGIDCCCAGDGLPSEVDN